MNPTSYFVLLAGIAHIQVERAIQSKSATASLRGEREEGAEPALLEEGGSTSFFPWQSEDSGDVADEDDQYPEALELRDWDDRLSKKSIKKDTK